MLETWRVTSRCVTSSPLDLMNTSSRLPTMTLMPLPPLPRLGLITKLSTLPSSSPMVSTSCCSRTTP